MDFALLLMAPIEVVGRNRMIQQAANNLSRAPIVILATIGGVSITAVAMKLKAMLSGVLKGNNRAYIL